MSAKMGLRPAVVTLVLAAVVCFVLDQATKYWVLVGLDLDNRLYHEVWPPYLTFKMAWNAGINFGLFSSGSEPTRWILIGLSVAVSAGIAVWALRRRSRGFVIGSGILIGGAIGNAVDRLIHGKVADFLNMSCCGFDNPFSFNVADVAIFLGAAIIALKG